MAMVVSSMSGQLHSKLTRSLEKILEEAQASGELNLSGRKLKEFPDAGDKYDLLDTVLADLSKNRFGEVPAEVTAYASLERLQLYHNTIRFIPDTVVYLQSLSYLDLSRNQLSVLPCVLCQLPLEVLLLSNNKLVGIPEDIGRMRTLAELDASCNEIAHLPKQIGDLPVLRALNVRQNHLKELPLEITYLRLVKLDISENRISALPNELRTMTTLVEFQLSHNPLVSPPAQLCRRGRVHIFKYLEIQALKEDKKRGFLTEDVRRSHKKGDHLSELRGYANGVGLDLRHHRYNVDSGYSTSSDGLDKRWSQEMHGEEAVSNVKGQWQRSGSVAYQAEMIANGDQSGSSTPSTISPGDSMNFEEELGKALQHDQIEKKRLDRDVKRRTQVITDGMKAVHGSPRFPSNNVNKVPLSPSEEVVLNGNSLTPTTDNKRPLEHTQTYREYKEALKQQRGQDVYRPRISGEHLSSALELYRQPETSMNQFSEEVNPSNHELPILRNRSESASSSKPLFEDTVSRRPVQKVIPCRNSSSVTFSSPPRQSPPISNSSRSDVCYVKPSSPVKTPCPSTPRLVTASVGYVNGNHSQGSPTPRSPKLGARAMMWNRDVAPEKLSFTMRREFEKAREEAELIDQLRSVIESRLKMSLPEDMAPALMDGVVLCHLANQVRPRSVASIHVPSPAVPKLTMARCRRNVDNFLEACRKIGVEEEDVCSQDDIIKSFRVSAVYWTVEKLIKTKAAPTKASPMPEEESGLISLLCLSLFFGTLVLLYFFPLPN